MEQNPQASDNIHIALIQKDVGYIREALAKIEGKMEAHDKIYAKKDELVEVVKDMEQSHKAMQTLIDQKVNNSDFDPIKKTLNRIAGLVITAIVGALIALVVKI